MTKRFLRYSGLGLAVLTVGAVAACGSSDNSGGPSSAAGSSAAGAHTAGVGGLPASGGLPGSAGATVTAGSSSGGASAAGAGTGGSGGAGVGFPCAGSKPTSASFTDFSDLVASLTSAGNYTFMAGVPGGTYTYQPAALTLDVTGMSLNVKGNVKDYDGFGVYTTACTDASAYTGVSFSIKGTPGASGTLSFRIQTNSDTAIDTVNKKGTCVVPPGTTDTYSVCHAPALDIPVTSAGGTVSVNFSQLAGGIPVDGLTGNEILGLEWAFTWNPPAAGTGGAGGSGAYDVNVTLDDIKFIGGSSGGASGAGGAAGAGGASAGAGGASAGAGGASAGAGGSAAGSGGTAGH